MSKSRFLPLLLLSIVLLLGGCAAGRSVVTTAFDPGVNPATGTTVRIEPVEDARVFTAAPPQADMPSLMNADELGNKAITSRAIARKRGGFGAALGDVLLPEGESVQQLSRAAVTRALRETGYRVAAPGESGYADAIPIRVRIDEFWSWFSPGFAQVAVSFRGKLHLQGNIGPVAAGASYSAEVQDRMQAVFESDWAAVVTKGVAALSESVRKGLAGNRPPGAP